LAGKAPPPSGGSITPRQNNTTFTHHANRNQTPGLRPSINHTPHKKPRSITQSTRTLFFSHHLHQPRFKTGSPGGQTRYLDAFGVHAELFVSATSAWYDFIGAGGTMLGVRVLHSDNSVTTRYFHTDNLGSIAVITNESGAVVERDSYDAWGKRRFPTGADDPSGSLTSQTTRGFTGQEELADVGLVHLNGRVYDPLVGRMMSADPTVPDPMNGQAWNRYSYVANNPLAFIDPSGYSWLSHFFHSIGTFLYRTIGSVFRHVPILGNLLEIAAVVLCVGVCAPFAPLVAALTTTFVAGVTSRHLRHSLKAGLIAGVTAIANFGVGTLAKDLAAQGLGGLSSLVNVAGHALVGCASAAASGGKCGPAALSAGVSAAAGPVINGHGQFADLVSNAVVGGLASVAGGGKFANGA